MHNFKKCITISKFLNYVVCSRYVTYINDNILVILNDITENTSLHKCFGHITLKYFTINLIFCRKIKIQPTLVR